MKSPLWIAVSAAALACAACSPQPSSPFRKIERTSSAIVGGTNVADSGFPYVPLIYNHQQGYLCTGTLIDDFVVLTAAHCVDDPNASHYDICGGEDPFGEGCYWLTGAASVHAHPQYDEQQLVNDVGVIVLDAEPHSQDSATDPIPYLATNDSNVYKVGSTFTAVGFGITNGSPQAPDDSGVKRQVQLSMTEVYSDIFLYGSSSKNTCSGDSGGPALANVNGQMTVVGVVSFGDQYCTQFGGDSRTNYFQSWIAQYAGAGATPTPTPTNPGGGGDDDDDGGGSEPGKGGDEADDPFGNVGCSLAQAGRLASFPGGFLALAAVAALVRRRQR